MDTVATVCNSVHRADRLITKGRERTVGTFNKTTSSFIYNSQSWPGSSVGRAED
jgi:hypothetical protein